MCYLARVSSERKSLWNFAKISYFANFFAKINFAKGSKIDAEFFLGGIKICDYFAKNSPESVSRKNTKFSTKKNISRKMRDFYILLETLHLAKRLDSIAGETEEEFLKFYGQSREIRSLNRELIPRAGFTLTIITLTWVTPDTIW